MGRHHDFGKITLMKVPNIPDICYDHKYRKLFLLNILVFNTDIDPKHFGGFVKFSNCCFLQLRTIFSSMGYYMPHKLPSPPHHTTTPLGFYITLCLSTHMNIAPMYTNKIFHYIDNYFDSHPTGKQGRSEEPKILWRSSDTIIMMG